MTIFNNIDFVSYMDDIGNELAHKARRIAYLSSLGIMIILTSFYLVIRRLYLRKEAIYVRCKNELETKESFRMEYIKLTKLLYRPIVSKLKSKIYHNGDQKHEVNALFSVVDLEDSRINIKDFFSSLSNFFYTVKFQLHNKISANGIRVGVNHASLCQIIYSLVNHINNHLGDNQNVDVTTGVVSTNLIIEMRYTISEFISNRQFYNSEELLHPFLINSAEIFEALNKSGISCQKTSSEFQCTITVQLPLENKISKGNSRIGINNVCHIKDYTS